MKTILVIEDSVDVRFLYQVALESDQYRVLLAGNGAEALDMIKKGPTPELVLLDLTLPDMNGSELIECMRALPELEKTKVVLVSGRDDLAAVAKKVGSYGFLRKPFDLDRLTQTVDQSLGL